MTAHTYSATSIGYEGKLIDVESDSSNGLPTLIIVGLGNKSVDEAKERVRSAIKNSGMEFPRKRITINLAPADLPKDGSHLDLPIALSILQVSKQIPEDALTDTLFAGELSLDGTLKPITGAINYAEVARDNGFKKLVVPLQNIGQASLIEGIEILGAQTLKEVFMFATSDQQLHTKSVAIAPAQPTTITRRPVSIDAIHGQDQAKRALVIAAAGGHNILFDGPPGSGKTMLAQALISLLPPMTSREVIETTKIYSLAGEAAQNVIATRPFRSPHHSASTASLIGGGVRAKPGEISLAHHGVLFLDELPEYSRAAIESLRQPLEDRIVTITRANHRGIYPANFMLVATQNPCPCGYAGDPTHECSCTSQQILNYQKKISGPLMDRIDLYVTVSPVEHTRLLQASEANAETIMAKAIVGARITQQKRFNNTARTNANLSNKDIQQKAYLTPDAKLLLDKAARSLNLSARAYFRTIKVARSIADLESSPNILVHHVSEALQYRPRSA